MEGSRILLAIAGSSSHREWDDRKERRAWDNEGEADRRDNQAADTREDTGKAVDRCE